MGEEEEEEEPGEEPEAVVGMEAMIKAMMPTTMVLAVPMEVGYGA